MPVANPDPSINLDKHKFEENQVLIYVPVYNKSTGLYGGLKKMLGHITLRGDESKRYFSYGYSKEKSNVLLYGLQKASWVSSQWKSKKGDFF